MQMPQDLVRDLIDFFEREFILMEGNYGLTGYETDEEVAEMEPGTVSEISDMRENIKFRERLSKIIVTDLRTV